MLGFWCGVAPQYSARRRLYSDPHGGFLNVFRFQEHAWQCCLLSGDMRRHLEKLLPHEVPPEPFVLGRAASVLANSSSLRPRALLQETSPSLACLLEPQLPDTFVLSGNWPIVCAHHCMLRGSSQGPLAQPCWKGEGQGEEACVPISHSLSAPAFCSSSFELPLNTSEGRTWGRLGELGELCPT